MSVSVPMIRQTAGRGAARAAARSRGLGAARRPGLVTYVLLGLVLALSAYPLYYAVLLASSDSATIAQNPIPSLIPGPNLIDNLTRVVTSDIGFWRAVLNSVIVAVITSLSVVFFATLAGYAFARLRFAGRRGLLVFVIATMAVPTQLGVVPLFIVMRNLELTGALWAVILPGMVTA
ncbi:MAG TPA: carbohydrate ABC transporter permease, partial [Actinotalea sp.]|nr:carbohydrate ABC transporter permease [Actinotalea sp.]